MNRRPPEPLEARPRRQTMPPGSCNIPTWVEGKGVRLQKTGQGENAGALCPVLAVQEA